MDDETTNPQNVIADCAAMREAAAVEPYTIEKALDQVAWLRKVPDGFLSSTVARQVIEVLAQTLEKANAAPASGIPEPVQVLVDWFSLSAGDFDSKHPDKANWSRDKLIAWVQEQL